MTNAEARFNNSLRPRKPEGSLGRTAQDVHLDSHTAPELCAWDGQPSSTAYIPTIPAVSRTQHWLVALAQLLNTWHCFPIHSAVRVGSFGPPITTTCTLHGSPHPHTSPHCFPSLTLGRWNGEELGGWGWGGGWGGVTLLIFTRFSASFSGTWTMMLATSWPNQLSVQTTNIHTRAHHVHTHTQINLLTYLLPKLLQDFYRDDVIRRFALRLEEVIYCKLMSPRAHMCVCVCVSVCVCVCARARACVRLWEEVFSLSFSC